MTQPATKRLVTEQSMADQFAANLTREALAVKDYEKLAPWFAAASNWRVKRANAIFFGDSNPEGYSLTDWNHTSPSQLQQDFRTRYGVPPGGRGFIGVQNDLVNKPFWPMAYASGGFTATGYGTNARQYSCISGQHITFTVAAGGITSFDIHYALYGSGTAYYKIDGGAVVTFPTAGSGSIVPATLHVNLPVTSTIEIGGSAGTSYISGIQEFKDDYTAGLQVHNCGWSGSYVRLWADAVIANRSWRQQQALLTPDLIVINLGGNDARILGGNRTAAQFQADLAELFASLSVVSTIAPIAMNMQWNMGDSLLVEPWVNYVKAAKTVCEADPRAVLIDHNARMYASNTVDKWDLYNPASPPHAKAKGYALYARTIDKAVEPR